MPPTALTIEMEAILKDWELLKKISQAVNAAYEELSKKRLPFYLAAFLIGVQPNCYFQDGWIFKRAFEHASVRLDSNAREGRIDWK